MKPRPRKFDIRVFYTVAVQHKCFFAAELLSVVFMDNRKAGCGQQRASPVVVVTGNEQGGWVSLMVFAEPEKDAVADMGGFVAVFHPVVEQVAENNDAQPVPGGILNKLYHRIFDLQVHIVVVATEVGVGNEDGIAGLKLHLCLF